MIVGDTLVQGRISILRQLGTGGMGAVYESFDRERKERVALKVLTRSGGADIYRLKNEFRSLVDIAHPNLVTLYELFEERGLWFFTMELVPGVHLDLWLRDGVNDALPGQVAEGRLDAAFAQLLSGVAAIHAAGKLHLDLKPSNVLVTPSGRLAILDFGLAVDAELGGAGHTLAELKPTGTPAYMAPEQIRGAAPSPASDLYAIGVMLFEALSGRLPFEGRAHEMLYNKQWLNAPALSMLVPSVAPETEALCMRLLAREPIARPTLFELRARFPVVLAPTPEPLPSQSTETRLVGREAELGALRSAYDASCRGEKPVVVLIAGPSGIGKSALVQALLCELRGQGHALILAGRCFERESVPYKAFDAVIDALSRYLRQQTPEQVNALLPRDAFILGTLFPVLGRISEIAQSPPRACFDPPERRRRAFLALGELLGRIRDRRPLVVCIDDLQWSDPDSTVLIMHLLRQPDAPPLLLVASHRSEQSEGHPCLLPLYRELPVDVRLDVRRIKLAELSDQASLQLLSERFPAAPVQLLREAGGNPFLLLELALHSSTSGALNTHSVRSLVAARIAALTPEERAPLELLAVAAGPIELSLAVAAAKSSVGPRTAFDALRRARLARGTGDGALVECFHDRVREALLATFDEPKLRALHRALADALSMCSAADPEQLAVHLLGAGERTRAVEHVERAAERASQELGFDRAARLYALALEHGQFSPAHVHELRVARARALAEAGRRQTAAAAYFEAVASASPREALELRLQAAEQWLCIGQLDHGLELLSEAFAAFDIPLAKTPAEVLASALETDRRLRECDYSWQGAADKSDDVSLRLALLRRGADSLVRLDYLRGAELGLRATLYELTHGSERDAVVGLCSLISYQTLLGADAARVSDAVARAERAVESWPEIMPVFLFYRGMARATGGTGDDPAAALADIERASEGYLEQRWPGAGYVRAMCAMIKMRVRACEGEYAAVARELPAQLDDAYNRGDLCLVPYWSGIISAFSGLAVGDEEGVAHRLERAKALWSPSLLTAQDMELYETEYRLLSYAGRTRAAWECLEVWFRRLYESPMRHGLWAQFAWRLRGTAAVALASELCAGSEQDGLLREAERCAASIGAPELRANVEAALACQRHDREAAAHFLRVAISRPQWKTERLALRRHLGVLIGGVEGAALRDEADAFFRAGGVVDIARFVDTMLPGFRDQEV